MPHYIVESDKPVIVYKGVRSVGRKAASPRKQPLYLHVLEIEDDIDAFETSPKAADPNRIDAPRRAPKGVGDWWIVRGRSTARLRGLNLRSNCRPLLDSELQQIRAQPRP
jgi:hypothetical protein